MNESSRELFSKNNELIWLSIKSSYASSARNERQRRSRQNHSAPRSIRPAPAVTSNLLCGEQAWGCMEKRFVLGDLRSLLCRSLSSGGRIRIRIREGDKSTNTSCSAGHARAPSRKRVKNAGAITKTGKIGLAQLPRSRRPRAKDARLFPLVHAFASAGGSSRKGAPAGLLGPWCLREPGSRSAAAMTGGMDASHDLYIVYSVTCSLPTGQQAVPNQGPKTRGCW